MTSHPTVTLTRDCPIADITLDDLKTRSSEKAKVWRGRL